MNLKTDRYFTYLAEVIAKLSGFVGKRAFSPHLLKCAGETPALPCQRFVITLAIIFFVFAFATACRLTVPMPAAGIDSSPAFDNGIAVSDVDGRFGDDAYNDEHVRDFYSPAIPLASADFYSSPTFSDDIAVLVMDGSLDEDEYREEDFNSLFENLEDDNYMFVDTSFAWDNQKVNAGRFDYRTLDPDDAIKIPLVDSSQDKYFAHPFTNQVTSRFGPRGNQWHYGIDIRLKTGDPVKCALDGIVRAIQYDRYGYGHVVVVRHHNGLETLYGHLSKVTVKTNQPIKAGEQVGLGGNTGHSTGPHLHFEIRYYGEPFNPEYIIDFNNYALKSDTLVLTRNNFEYLTDIRKTVYYTVSKGDTLSGIAKRYGTTVNNLCQLNGIAATATLSIGRRLVVRKGDAADGQAAASKPNQASANPLNTQALAGGYYTVRSGDNLSSIARRYGTTVSDLCRLNGITADATLSIGRRLLISGADGQVASDKPAPVSTIAQNTQVASAQTTASSGYYTVRSGDNLSSIAKRYGTTVNNLCRLNGITADTTLSVGRRLVVE